jgi:hypothetical protein
MVNGNANADINVNRMSLHYPGRREEREKRVVGDEA